MGSTAGPGSFASEFFDMGWPSCGAYHGVARGGSTLYGRIWTKNQGD